MSEANQRRPFRFLPPHFLIESLGIYPKSNQAQLEKKPSVLNWLSLVSIPISISAVFVAVSQLSITRIDERPWVSATLIEGAKCNEERSSAVFLRLKNLGKTVAENLFVTVNLTDLSSSDSFASSSRSCDSATRNLFKNDFSIIPGDTFSSASYYSDNEGNRIDIPYINREIVKLKVPALVGCASYKSIFDNTAHKTLFFSPLRRTDFGFCVENVYSLGAD